MLIKKGVHFEKGNKRLSWEAMEGMLKTRKVYKEWGITGVRACITSVMDGKHKEGSKHYTGEAWDCRTWNADLSDQMTQQEKEALARALRDELGPDYDVVVEATHIHCEYDPE